MAGIRRFVLTILCLLGTQPLQGQQTPPNLLVILTDDQRNDFLGCAGHPVLKTPNIDALAAEGVRFTNAFVTTSICAASRASILTGTWERRHGFTFGKPPVPEDLLAASYPAQLRVAGYRTGFVGKYGMKTPPGTPAQLFDDFKRLGQPFRRKQPDGKTKHTTDLIRDHAMKFIRESKDQPFCLSLSFNAAHAHDGNKVDHYPCAPSEEGLYEDAKIRPPRVSTDFWETLPEFFRESMHRDRWFWRWDTPEKYRKNVRAYYRLITGVDRVVGELRGELTRLGLAKNTVIVFLSDNGYYKGSRGFAGKWSHYEESLRVPFIVYDPRLPPESRGRTAPELILNTDLAPTLLELGRVTIPEEHQGRSLAPLVKGKPVTHWRTDFFCEHLMDNRRIPKWEGVRGTRYVYARYFEHLPEGEFLHDLEEDPLQLRNLATDPAHRETLSKLRARCDELRDQIGR